MSNKKIKAISGIKLQKQKDMIPCMISGSGCEVHERQAIANTFADFYAGLYGDADREQRTTLHATQMKIEEFTWDEMETAIKMLKKKKAPDNANVCAEMIKYGGDTLKHVLLATFNNILQLSMPTPETWRKTTVSYTHLTLPTIYSV